MFSWNAAARSHRVTSNSTGQLPERKPGLLVSLQVNRFVVGGQGLNESHLIQLKIKEMHVKRRRPLLNEVIAANGSSSFSSSLLIRPIRAFDLFGLENSYDFCADNPQNETCGIVSLLTQHMAKWRAYRSILCARTMPAGTQKVNKDLSAKEGGGTIQLCRGFAGYCRSATRAQMAFHSAP